MYLKQSQESEKSLNIMGFFKNTDFWKVTFCVPKVVSIYKKKSSFLIYCNTNYSPQLQGICYLKRTIIFSGSAKSSIMHCIISLIQVSISIFHPLISIDCIVKKLCDTSQIPGSSIVCLSSLTPPSEPNKPSGTCQHTSIKQRKRRDMLYMLNSAGKFLCISSGDIRKVI